MMLTARKDVPVAEAWDLGLIFPNDDAMWEALEELKKAVERFAGRMRWSRSGSG